jgi:hypothetical protein
VKSQFKSNFKIRTIFIVGYLSFVGFLLLGLAIIRVNVVKESYQLQEAKIKKSELLQAVSEKEVAYSQMLTPAKIEWLAIQKFKLSKPSPKQITYFKSQE